MIPLDQGYITYRKKKKKENLHLEQEEEKGKLRGHKEKPI